MKQPSLLAAFREVDRDWTAAPLRELIDHLVDVEHALFRNELDSLYRQLLTVATAPDCANVKLRLLAPVFRSLVSELEAHMQGEERELFPEIIRYLDAIEAGTPLKGSPLSAFGGPLHLMEQEHESSAAALRVMRDFCQNYRVTAETDPVYAQLLRRFSDLEEGLLRHIYLENNVLYPRAAALKAGRFSRAL
jgi:regulator of cell morphogenesis and NO signaling